MALTGRIAPCASWAFFAFVLYTLGFSVMYSGPYRSFISWRISSWASADKLTPSVLMYVMRPSPETPSPSYRAWALRIVEDVVIPRRLEASCCMVEVVNGAGGCRSWSFSEMPATSSCAAFNLSTTRRASSLSEKPLGPSLVPSTSVKCAENTAPSSVDSNALIVQYCSTLKASISASLSLNSLSATLCTLPALRAPGSFLQSTGLMLNPTR
mmetsp:Transcript_23889/g.66277  ORF Transcript_23889/g.66277 Transcript_23889/m.66277 type:complete len:212 (+) Transcript_23889:2012-2647(+)